MVNSKPKVVSLFAGCGGSICGYQKSGFEPVLGVDIDELSLCSLQSNYPSCVTLIKDIRSLSSEEILELVNLKPGKLDLLDSSPPCQGFSVAGKRVLLDPRNDLIFDVIRLIKEIQPKSFVIENVDGMLKGGMRGYFNLIIENLSQLNYSIKWKSMNGIYYGLPQKRQRLFFLGIREDLGVEPQFPPHVKKSVFFDDVVKGVEYQSRGQFDKKWKTTRGNYCYTITKSPSLRFKSNGVERDPTIEELKLLSSFPEDYFLCGTFNQQWGQIGNAVPPVLSFSLTEVFRNFSLYK